MLNTYFSAVAFFGEAIKYMPSGQAKKYHKDVLQSISKCQELLDGLKTAQPKVKNILKKIINLFESIEATLEIQSDRLSVNRLTKYEAAKGKNKIPETVKWQPGLTL